MTIIKPSLHRKQILFLFIFFGVFVIGGLVAIFEYKAIADLRYDIKTMKITLISLKTENAELKNEFYTATETSKLETLALERGLVLEKTPDYMGPNQWLSASSY